MEEIREEYFSGFSIESIESSIINIQKEKTLQTQLANALEKLPLRQKQVINHLFFEHAGYDRLGFSNRIQYAIK